MWICMADNHLIIVIPLVARHMLGENSSRYYWALKAMPPFKLVFFFSLESLLLTTNINHSLGDTAPAQKCINIKSQLWGNDSEICMHLMKQSVQQQFNNQLDGEPPDAAHLAELPVASSVLPWLYQLKKICSLFIKTNLSKIIYSFARHPIFSHLLIKDANVDK